MEGRLCCPVDAQPLVMQDAAPASWRCASGHRFAQRGRIVDLLPGGEAPGFGRLRAATYDLTFDLVNVRMLFGATPADLVALHRDAARAASAGCLLDVACGTSRWALPHLEAAGVGSYLGVDSALPMLRLAEQRSRSAAAEVWLLHCEAERLPLRSGSVDAALTSLGLQFVADKDAALAELRRVLRPGGQLFAVAPALGLRARYDRRFHRRARKDAPLELARWPSQLAGAGFPDPQITTIGALVFTRARAA